MKVSQEFLLPPPIGGLNLRDTETQFPQGGGVPLSDAVGLTNIFPGSTTADVRGGYEEYVDLTDDASFGSPPTTTFGTGDAAVKTLATLVRGANTYFVAGCDGGFVDISITTLTQLTAQGTHTSSRWNWVNFTDSAGSGNELLLVNGADTPQSFDGTTMSSWTFSAETGSITSADVIGIITFKNRVYLWENDSTDFWYGYLGKKPGTTASVDRVRRFPLSAVRGIQGNIIAMEAWTRDAGDGADDYLAIILSSGVVAIYQGTDPDTVDASIGSRAWALVGVYQIPPPIDARAVNKFLDDVVIVTESDVVFLSQVIRNQGITGTESKIAPLVKRLAAQFKTLEGWELTLWPEGARVYLNVPGSGSSSSQIVFNTRTLAACEYQGYDACSFGAYNGGIYFSDANGIVWLAETGAQDNGGEIEADWRTPLLTFGKTGVKTISAIRPDLTVSDPVSIAALDSTDFATRLPVATTSTGDSTGWIWDTSPSSGPTWDDLKWSGLQDRTPQHTWKILSGTGEKHSVSLQVRLDDIAMTINSMGIAWMPGSNWM